MASAAARTAPAFKLGKKQVFLPNVVVSLVRRDFQPADWATFQVPLRFTKFDIRDYLYNLYDVEVKAVRSWVRRPTAPTRNNAGRFVRPNAEKYMTVEMTKPFVWPEEPIDLSPWDNELYNMRQSMMDQQEKVQAQRYKGNIALASDSKLGQDEMTYRELAQQLLRGDKKWDNGVELDGKWDALVGKKKEGKKKEGKKKDEGKKKKEVVPSWAGGKAEGGAGEKKLDE